MARLAAALAAALSCSIAGANSDPLNDAIAPGGVGIGYAMRIGNSPYRGANNGNDHLLAYFYEGEQAYLHASRLGLKFEQDAWRVDAFLRLRFEGYTQNLAPSSTVGMELREPGFDAGFAVRRRTSWGTPYAEVTRDVSHRSRGIELKLGYWNEWARGRLSLKPHVAVSLRDSKLNDFYYGVTPAEATAQRQAYAPGGGVDLEFGLYGTYRLTENWQLFGGLGALRRAREVRASPIVENHTEVSAMLGLLYDFSPQMKRWAPESRPLIARTFYGHSTDCNLIKIVPLACTSTHTQDQTDVWGFELGRTLINQPYGWPMDITGFVGLVRHLEKGYQDDFWQVNGYLRARYWGFPWDRWLRTRVGFGGGLAYAEHIPEIEARDQARRGRGTWKLLNYLDPTVDFRLGDLIPARALRDTYLGLGVSHRSGMFGKSLLFGDVNGGSNFIYTYVETTF